MKTTRVASASLLAKSASLLLAFGVVASASVPGARLLEDGHDADLLEDALSLAELQAPHGGWGRTPPHAGDPSKLCTAPGWMGPPSPEQWGPSGMTPWNRGRKLESAKTPKAGTGKWRAPRPKSDGSETCSAGAECQGYSMLKVASIEGEGGPGELETTLAAGSSNFGVMFQVKAKKAMVINSFKLHLAGTGTTVDVEVWHRSGSYAGYDDSAVGWTKALDDVTITSAGVGALTETPDLDSPVSAASGATHSFYIVTSDYQLQREGSSEFDPFASNDDLEFFEGRGCSFREFSCNSVPRVFNGAILYDIPSPPVSGTWTQFATLAGQSGVRAYPGTTGDDLGTLENCQLAPIASKDELADMILEVRRIVVNSVLAQDGGTVDDANDILENESFWLGVVKAPAQVAADNGGNGSRLGWKNLDGTPADVCDADWLGVGAGGGEQPDGSTDGALDTRLVLINGKLKDYPDSGEDVMYAVYQCCMATISFLPCGAVA